MRRDSLLIGSRIYELTNHLGNVLATISDKKIGNDSSGVVNYFTAEVLSQNDYYPFGMGMPGRKFTAGLGYRYGFNGKENDNEVKGEGNQQDYGMRIYDPRLGRFLSVDPLTTEYPELTPYQFSSNSPIANVDLDGEERLYYSLNFDQDGKPVLKLTNQENTYRDQWTGKTSNYPLTYIISYGNETYTFFESGGRYDNVENSTSNVGAWFYAASKGVKVPGFTELFYSDHELQVELLNASVTEWGEGLAMAKSQAPEGNGTIYVVPGTATTSGKDYVGRHNKSNPSSTRRSADGRDRTKLKVVDRYNEKDPLEGQYKEQKHMILRGGIKKLDNKRNEVNPLRMEELEKIYGGKNKLILPQRKSEKSKENEEQRKKEQQKVDDMIKYHG